MRFRNVALALVVIVPGGCLLTGCGGSTYTETTAPADTKVDPGPNPTTGDPGPNDTANGPQTLQGTLTTHSGCVELKGNAANEPKRRYQLEFEAEKVKHEGDTIVLSGTDGERSVGSKDTIFVTGLPGSGTGPCGKIFNVEKVVAVTPG